MAGYRTFFVCTPIVEFPWGIIHSSHVGKAHSETLRTEGALTDRYLPIPLFQPVQRA